MKINVGILNLCTRWSSSGDGVNTDTLLTTACYSTNFVRFRGHQYYVIEMYHSLAGYRNSVRNNTFLDMGGLIDHIQWIKDFLPEGIVGDFTVSDNAEDNIYRVTLNITGANIYHRLVLNWIRYAYELPYSLILMDTYRLNDVEEFKDLNRINKFILCSSIYGEKSTYYWRTDMSFGHFTRLQSTEETLKKLETTSHNIPESEGYHYNQTLNDHVFNEILPNGSNDLKLLDYDEDLLDTERWVDGKDFLKRLELYKYNFKFCKKDE